MSTDPADDVITRIVKFNQNIKKGENEIDAFEQT